MNGRKAGLLVDDIVREAGSVGDERSFSLWRDFSMAPAASGEPLSWTVCVDGYVYNHTQIHRKRPLIAHSVGLTLEILRL